MRQKTSTILMILLVSILFTTSCNQTTDADDGHNHHKSDISQNEVIDAQNSWAKAIASIGEAYTNKKDYRAVASNVVDDMYGYDEGLVLFTPTKASEKQFRLTKEEALSYFVGGAIPEDKGFALQPWSKVRFENAGIILNAAEAIAMGNYYFTDAKTGDETKVEYTFGYFKDEHGDLRINVHHSSLPYSVQ